MRRIHSAIALGAMILGAAALLGCGHASSTSTPAQSSQSPPQSAATSSAGQQQGAPSQSLLDALKAAHGETETKATHPPPTFPPMSPADVAAAPHVQRVPKLATVNVVNSGTLGDYEVLSTVSGLDAKGVTLTLSAEYPNGFGGFGGGSQGPVKINGTRYESTEDLLHATGGYGEFGNAVPARIPGTLEDVASMDSFASLKSTGKVVGQVALPGGALQSALVGGLAAGAAGEKSTWSKMPKVNCVFSRVEAQDVAFPVLLNGERVSLPAVHVHAKCDGTDIGGDSYVLDNPGFPLSLAEYSDGTIDFRRQTTEIKFGGDIEKALKDNRCTDVYGFYFDFDKDVLRPESAPVLYEIAAALKANPDWKLNVNGHTDNIGGDAHNMDLSNRRAAAVVSSLATRLEAKDRIDPARLHPAGFGATQPKESNDTIQGRARNRRVELCRQ